MKYIFILLLLSQFIFSELISYSSIKQIIIKECKKYPCRKINEKLIHAIMYYESRETKQTNELYNTKAESFDRCIGLMQIKKNTLIDYNKITDKNFKLKDLYDIKKNIHVGIWCIAKKLEITKGNLHFALYLYSGGAKGYPDKVMEKMIYYLTRRKK